MIDEHLAEYAKLVAERLAARDGKPFPNGSIAHAQVIIETMFRSAVQRIRIVTGELNEHVYGSPAIMDSASQFLSLPGRSLEIVFECPFMDSMARTHPLLSTIAR